MKLASSLPYLDSQAAFNSDPLRAKQDTGLGFSETWQTLGPFQIGTRGML